MAVLELFIVTPPVALDLCDQWDRDKDERAGELLRVIDAVRHDINARKSLRCLSCSLPVLETTGTTYCIGWDGSNVARHAAICPQCCEGKDPNDLFDLASASLMLELAGRTGSSGYVGHA